MSERVSVVIPTLNEADYLPRVLQALAAQTYLPEEVIVADAGSVDGTRDVARRGGAHVIAGGRPAAGRNAGARVAKGDILLFIDADVLPPPSFLETALGEFVAEGLDVAAPLVDPISDRWVNHLLCDLTNVLLQVVQFVSPHAGGFCIFARRKIHQALGGFNEMALMAEDHDYVQRAARLGEFGILTSVHIPVSVRRLEREGTIQVAAKYLYCELFALTGRPVSWMPFDYTFGAYSAADSDRAWFVDVRRLREQLSSLEDPLARLGEHGLSVLKAMGSVRLDQDGFEQRVHGLLPDEMRVLQRYLRWRLSILRSSGRPVLRRATEHLRLAEMREAIGLLESRWWKEQQADDEASSPQPRMPQPP